MGPTACARPRARGSPLPSISDAHPLAHHFDDVAQQSDATTLGMWVFLVTEVLFFGGLFATYTVYRLLYPHAFHDGSHHLDVVLGTINTVVLIGSSEFFRDLQDYRMLIFGASMITIMVWRPRGIVGSREPTVVLKERKSISGSLVREGAG